MPRIGTGDQLLLLLQERLATLGKASTHGSNLNREANPLARAQALAAFEGLDPDERRRAIVRGVLAQQLGDDLVSDPAFAAIAADVARIIWEDEDGRGLIQRALATLPRPS